MHIRLGAVKGHVHIRPIALQLLLPLCDWNWACVNPPVTGQVLLLLPVWMSVWALSFAGFWLDRAGLQSQDSKQLLYIHHSGCASIYCLFFILFYFFIYFDLISNCYCRPFLIPVYALTWLESSQIMGNPIFSGKPLNIFFVNMLIVVLFKFRNKSWIHEKRKI